MLPRRLSTAAAFVLAVSALSAPAVSLADPLASDSGAQVAASLVTANATVELPLEQALLDHTNADRAANGLPALQFDSDTLAIARTRAAQQLGQDGLSHDDADGQMAFARMLGNAHLPYTLAAENLARSSTSDSAVVARIEQALMQSPAHRENILDGSFARVAIGVATDANGQVAFAEIFRTGE